MAALALQNNLMVRVESVDGPRHTAFADWLVQARQDGVPFVEQVQRMPRNRPIAMEAIYYRTYATKDAALVIACGSPSLRRRFIEAIGLQDPALAGGVTDLEAHYAALKRAADAVIASKTTAEWRTILAKAGVPASGVALPLEILDDAQPAANDVFHRAEHPVLGPLTVLGPAVRLSDDGFVAGPATPPFGSEARALLARAGFSEAEVDALVAAKVTRTSF